MSELNIFAYFCNWCSYANEDLVEVSAMQDPPKIRIIKEACNDKIDPFVLIEALGQDADGVLVTCCRHSDCQHNPENYSGRYKTFFVQKLLEKIGINPIRIKHEWISASESVKFSQILTNYANLIEKIGPITIDDRKLIKDESGLLKDICNDSIFKWLFEKSWQLVNIGNVYDEKISEEKYLVVMDEIIDAKIIRKRLLDLISEKPLTIKDISKKFSLSSNLILKHLLALKYKQEIQLKMIGDDAKFAIRGE